MKTQKWEYYVTAISQAVAPIDLQNELNSCGSQGWQLVQVSTRGLDFIFFFEREIEK